VGAGRWGRSRRRKRKQLRHDEWRLVIGEMPEDLNPTNLR
jgi:hypothetical protein